MPKKFSVLWTAPANDGGEPITDYNIGYTPEGGSETVESHGGTTPPHEITGLTDNVLYTVRVRAVNSVGAGEWSSPVVRAAVFAPAQTTGLAVASTGDGTIDLSWSAPASEAAITDYRLEYTPSGGSATEVLAGSNATSYQLTGLTNDTEYSVRVAAISAGGPGDYSTAVTGTPYVPPPEPVSLDFSGSSGTRVYYSPVPETASTIKATLSSNRGGETISGGIDTSFGDQSVNFNLSSRVQFGHNHTGRYFIAGHTNRHCSGTVAVTIRDSNGNIVAQGTSPSQQFNGGDDD